MNVKTYSIKPLSVFLKSNSAKILNLYLKEKGSTSEITLWHPWHRQGMGQD